MKLEKSLGKRKLSLYKENIDNVQSKKSKKDEDFISWCINNAHGSTFENTELIITLINTSKKNCTISDKIKKINFLLEDRNILLNGGEIFDNVILYGDFELIHYFLDRNEDMSIKDESFDYFLKNHAKKCITQKKYTYIVNLIRKILYKSTIYFIGELSKEEVILNNYDLLKGFELINIDGFYTLFFKWRNHFISERKLKQKRINLLLLERIENTFNTNLKKMVQLMEINALHMIFTKYVRDMSFRNHNNNNKEDYDLKYSLFSKNVIETHPNAKKIQSSCVHTYYDFIENIVIFMPYMFINSEKDYMIKFQNEFTKKVIHEKLGFNFTYLKNKKKTNYEISFKNLMTETHEEDERKKMYWHSKKIKFPNLYLFMKNYYSLNEYLFLHVLNYRIQNKIKKEITFNNQGNSILFYDTFCNHFERISSYLY